MHTLISFWLFKRQMVMKTTSEVSIPYKNSSDVVIVQCLISFILLIISEVIMSWILEAASLLQPLHSALTLNGVTGNYSFHAWEGSFSEVTWRAHREKKFNFVTDKRKMENIFMFQPKTALSQNQSISVGINGIITAINSRGSFSYANQNCVCDKMNFSHPLF